MSRRCLVICCALLTPGAWAQAETNRYKQPGALPWQEVTPVVLSSPSGLGMSSQARAPITQGRVQPAGFYEGAPSHAAEPSHHEGGGGGGHCAACGGGNCGGLGFVGECCQAVPCKARGAWDNYCNEKHHHHHCGCGCGHGRGCGCGCAGGGCFLPARGASPNSVYGGGGALISGFGGGCGCKAKAGGCGCTTKAASCGCASKACGCSNKVCSCGGGGGGCGCAGGGCFLPARGASPNSVYGGGGALFSGIGNCGGGSGCKKQHCQFRGATPACGCEPGCGCTAAVGGAAPAAEIAPVYNAPSPAAAPSPVRSLSLDSARTGNRYPPGKVMPVGFIR